MISGTIVTHEEPAKYVYQPPAVIPYHNKYMDHWSNPRNTHVSFERKKQLLEQQMTIGDARGLRVGVRVRRVGNEKLIGSIISIADSAYAAWDMHCNEPQPYKVQWDTRKSDDGTEVPSFSYNYKEEDLEKLEIEIISDIQYID